MDTDIELLREGTAPRPWAVWRGAGKPAGLEHLIDRE